MIRVVGSKVEDGLVKCFNGGYCLSERDILAEVSLEEFLGENDVSMEAELFMSLLEGGVDLTGKLEVRYQLIVIGQYVLDDEPVKGIVVRPPYPAVGNSHSRIGQ
jgi:hypothetical protein